MKKFFSVGKNMIPAIVVILVLVFCAAMPELGVIPEKLTSSVDAAETQETEEAESETTDSESEEADAAETVSYEDPDGYIDGTYYGSAAGFGGEITVAVTVSGGIIVSIEIISAPGETESYLNMALAVIDRILSSQSPNVDAVSGATYSSNGIINAVKEALSQAAASSSSSSDDAASGGTTSGSSSSGSSSGSSSVSASALSGLPDYGYTDGTYIGTGTGFGGEVILSVTIEGGQITSIEVVSAEGETYAYWQQALVLLDTILEAQTTDGVDAVAGATYSSNGILEAVRDALSQAQAGNGTDADALTAGSDADDAVDSDDDTGSGTDFSSLPNYGYTDGTYTGTGTGFGGEVILSVTIEGGQITSIEVVSAKGETYAYWQQALVLLDTILEAQTTDGIDAVAGATYSSNGILEAVKDALSQAQAADETGGGSGTDTDDADDSADADNNYDADDSGDADDADAADDTDDAGSSIDFSSLPNYGYADGTYTGSGYGFGGDIVLTVTVSGGQIVSIEVADASGETYAYWVNAVTLLDTIILAQTWEVDAVSGATFSSEGIMEAVENALADAIASDDDSSSDDTDDADDPDDAGSGSNSDEADNKDDSEDAEDDSGTDSGGDEEDGTGEDESGSGTEDNPGTDSGGDEEDSADGDASGGDTEDDSGTDSGNDEEDSSDENTSDDDSEDNGAADDGIADEDGEDDEDAEPVTTEEVYTTQYSYTVTVTPDEDEDFDVYEAVITITVQTTVVTVTDGNTVTVTTTNEIIETAYESDTDSTNLRYLSRAWTKLIDSLTAGEEVDAVSGATCSSNAILEVWEQFYADVTLGTETVTYETASSYLAQTAALTCASVTQLCTVCNAADESGEAAGIIDEKENKPDGRAGEVLPEGDGKGKEREK